MTGSIKERLEQFIQEQGISVAEFERKCELSNGYFSKLKSSVGSEKLEKIHRAFPIIDLCWLITGEHQTGEIINQQVNGKYNTQVAGNDNNINTSSSIDKALNEIAEQRKLVAKAQEQIDRLISLLEKQ